MKKAAGVFLYMDCPTNPKERCALLIDRTYDKNIGTFTNPGGFVHNGEDADQGAVREVQKELGHLLRFEVSDLERDFDSAAKTGVIERENHSNAEGLGRGKYSLFFKQIEPIAADKIALAMKTSTEIDGSGKNPVVAIVPLQAIKENLTNGTPILVSSKDRRIYSGLPVGSLPQNTEIRLHPLMVSLLKENLRSNPQVNWLTWMMSKPRVEDIQAKRDLILSLRKINHPDQPQRDMLAIQEGLGLKYVPHKGGLILREHAARNPANLPYTASDAHIYLMMQDLTKNFPGKYPSNYMESAPMTKMVDDFMDDFALAGINIPYTNEEDRIVITPELRAQVHKILETERTHRNMYVAYHAMNQSNGLAMDLISAIRSKLMGRQVRNFGGIWDTAIQNMNFNTLVQFMELQLKESKKREDYHRNETPRNKIIYGRSEGFGYDFLGHTVLSSNLSLFGNNNVPLEYTFGYWVANRSSPLGFISGNALERVFVSLGINVEEGKKRLGEVIQELDNRGIKISGGRLLQIFMNPDIVDKIAYVAAGNRPLELEMRDQLVEWEHHPSKILYRMRQNPVSVESQLLANAELSSLQTEYQTKYPEDVTPPVPLHRPKVNWLQLRILPIPAQATKDYNVEVISYSTNPMTPEQERIYWDKINALADELLQPALRAGLKGFVPHGRTQPPKLMREFRAEHPDQIIEKPSSAVVRGWIDAEDQNQLLGYLSVYPQDLEMKVTDYHTIISYACEKEKWQLLETLLSKAEPMQLSAGSLNSLANLTTGPDKDQLEKIISQGFFRFPLTLDFWKALFLSFFHSYLGTYVFIPDEDRLWSLKMIDKIIENNLNLKKQIIDYLSGKESVFLLDHLLKKYPKDVDGKIVLRTVALRANKIFPPYNHQRNKVQWLSQLKVFLSTLENYLRNESCEDLDEPLRASFFDPLSNESLIPLEEFVKKLDKQKYPNFYASMENVINHFEKIEPNPLEEW